MSPTLPPPLILFDMDPAQPWVTGIYRGLTTAPESREWNVRLTRYRGVRLMDVEARVQAEKGRPRGVVTERPELAALCGSRGIPVVVYGLFKEEDLPKGVSLIRSDYYEMGRRSARHLLERGYPVLTVVDTPENRAGAHIKTSGFLEAVAEAGASGHLVQPPLFHGRDGWLDETSEKNLTRWVRSLGRPLGIAASNVNVAWSVSRALRRNAFSVPEDVGLIAIGEDPVLLEQGRPPISAVAEDGERKGRGCAEVLATRMRGGTVSALTKVPPLGIIQRASTDHFAVEDPTVARALRLIRDQVEDLEGVEDLARRCHVSRATLLRRFREHRGHLPGEEIRKARIRRAVELIEETDLPMAEVAVASGLGLPSALSRAIKQATGKTPSQLRLSRDKVADRVAAASRR